MLDFSSSPANSISQIAAAEQVLGTLTWTGSVSPSGTVAQTYKWIQVGNIVTFWFKVTASVAGTLTTQIAFALPADLPLPNVFASQPVSTVVVFGNGAIAGSALLSINIANVCMLIKNSGGTYEVRVLATALAATNAWGTITYSV